MAKLQEPYAIEEQIEICEVPAPPMKELQRGELIKEKCVHTDSKRKWIL